MDDYGVRFARGFSLHEAIALLEESDEETTNAIRDITIFSPINSTTELTDEDSGDEEHFSINNLPGSQLRAPVELNFRHNDDNIIVDESFSSEDDLTLSEIKKIIEEEKKKSKKVKTKKRKMNNWMVGDLPTIESDFGNNIHNEEPHSIGPLELFSKFFDESILELIIRETNRYAQQKNKKGNIEKSEMKSFIGVLILSGYIRVPRRRIYWEREKDGRNELVAEAISRDRFEYILSNFHLSDNENLPQNDRFAKVRPLFDHLKNKCLENAHCEEMHSIDEAMVPYYGRHGCKQYIRGKPIRYGYKLWVGTTRLGYINWFEPYQGSSTNISETYAELGVGAGVVLEYADALRRKWPDKKFHLFFDNFFTSLPLIEELTTKNLHATGTVRENRLPGSNLMDSKILKKKNRGSFDFKKIEEKNIIAVKWQDNSIVSLCSNFSGVAPLHSVKRYSQKEKKNIQVDQPHLIHMYNANMGGVDRSDQNVSLYRVGIRGKKWYWPLIAHCIDLSIQNAWQLHRKKGGNLDQLSFRRIIATTLLVQNKKKKSYQRGHPTSLNENDMRYDRLDHLVVPQVNQTRCALCHQKTTTRCSKCDVGLHTKCFVMYHQRT